MRVMIFQTPRYSIYTNVTKKEMLESVIFGIYAWKITVKIVN